MVGKDFCQLLENNSVKSIERNHVFNSAFNAIGRKFIQMSNHRNSLSHREGVRHDSLFVRFPQVLPDADQGLNHHIGNVWPIPLQNALLTQGVQWRYYMAGKYVAYFPSQVVSVKWIAGWVGQRPYSKVGMDWKNIVVVVIAAITLSVAKNAAIGQCKFSILNQSFEQSHHLNGCLVGFINDKYPSMFGSPYQGRVPINNPSIFHRRRGKK
mmetsp:Transcript_19747/g.54373  ORF Transcript_19747/g.54373 Transcript_19747/m.54373 type:complete len:211 (+) Transcript_19747:212-844(+)